MNLTAYCKLLYNATGIHVSVLQGGEPVYSSLADALRLPAKAGRELPPLTRNPYFCGIPPHVLYGVVHVEDTANDVILGPILNIPVTDELLAQIREYLLIPDEYTNMLRETLAAMPVMNGLELSKRLALLHMTLNGQETDYTALYDTASVVAPEFSEASSRAEKLELGDLHNSYFFELEMYQKVREGGLEQLTRFFQENAHLRLHEGRMAHTPLRHAKNVFITAVAKAGFIGAIPGGVDVEKVYYLMDFYIRECEKLTTVEAVNNLQYAMVRDFCARSGEAKRPDSISSDVWYCMNYIRSHIYDVISLADVAGSIHRSVSYVTKMFKKELGVHVSAYITRCKLEEAKTMLIFTEKTLSQISSSLCFSSQSYFQNLFKKAFGITPARFRRQARTI